MSNFEVKIQRIFIQPHPNADRLEIGNIGSHDGFQVVIGAGRFKTGDLIAYIPEAAVVPEWVLKKYGYWDEVKNKGMLAGSAGDRVKAVRLRDAFSLGICIPVQEVSHGYDDEEKMVRIAYELEDKYVSEDEDVAELLGITKFQPPIPTCMAGEVYNAGTSITVNYDIENIKKYPDIFAEGELVQVTGKLHGTFTQLVYIPMDHPESHKEHLVVEVDGISGQFALASKGLGAQGLCFKWNEANSNNLYQKTVRKYLPQILKAIAESSLVDEVLIICGETFGHNVQDLHYGFKPGQTDFRVFDMYKGTRGTGHYVDKFVLDYFCQKMGLKQVQELYSGPFDMSIIEPLCQQAMETEFDEKQIREGVVICSVIERRTDIGRAQVKYINDAYALRKNKNATEFN